MGSTLPDRLKWLELSLQGLAYWTGYRRVLYDRYHLVEGAFVAELCNLIQGRLPPDLGLFPEWQYRRIVPEGVDLEGVAAGARADLVVCRGLGRSTRRDTRITENVQAVIEVKTRQSADRLVDEDLKRLAMLKAALPGVRAILVYASEAHAPERFVKKGLSIRGKHPVPKVDWAHFRVRRTCKAAASFEKLIAQHYVCMIEVFTG